MYTISRACNKYTSPVSPAFGPDNACPFRETRVFVVRADLYDVGRCLCSTALSDVRLQPILSPNLKLIEDGRHVQSRPTRDPGECHGVVERSMCDTRRSAVGEGTHGLHVTCTVSGFFAYSRWSRSPDAQLIDLTLPSADKTRAEHCARVIRARFSGYWRGTTVPQTSSSG